MTTPRRCIRAGAAVVFMGGLAITGITAFACTSTATLSFSRGGVATVGDTVTGTGSGFSVAPGHSPVSLYLNGFSGTPLTTASVAANGSISFQFVAPNVSTQYNFVGATETDSAGNSLTMGKVRGALTINAAPAPAPQPNPVQPPAQPPAQQPAPAQPPAQPPVANNPAPAGVSKPAAASKPVNATGAQAQAPVAAQPAPAAAAPQAAAPQVAPIVAQPAPAYVAPAAAPVQPAGQQPAAGASSGAQSSSSHPAAVLAMALVLGVLVLSVAVAAFVAAGRRGAGAEAKARR